MAPNTTMRLTPLAQLIDMTLTAKRGLSLATYLAIHRTPGPAWQTYDQITADLADLTGRALNRVSIKTFAEKLVGLPDTRYQDIDGKPKSMPALVPAGVLNAYLSALPAAVDVGDVRAHAAETAQAHAETAAILADPDTVAAIEQGETELTTDN